MRITSSTTSKGSRPRRQTKGGGVRTGRPFDGYSANGGLGVVARRYNPDMDRFIDGCAKRGLNGLAWFAKEAPFFLLRALVDSHPMAKMALSNNLSLAFGNGATQFFAVKDYRNGKGQKDDGATELLNQLWKDGYKSVSALQKAVAKSLHTDGMAVVEAVPGQGIVDGIYDCDSLNFRFNDKEPELGRHGRVLEIRDAEADGGWREVDQTTVFTTANNYTWDSPCGEPIFGAFPTDGLADIAQNRNVNDGLRAAFFSRLALEIPWSKWYELAKEEIEKDYPTGLLLREGATEDMSIDEKYLTAVEYADDQSAGWIDSLNGLKADDSILLAEGANAKALNITLQGIEGILDKRLLRVAQSLLHFPALLGITFGGREAWAKEQVKVYVEWLSDLRTIVNDLLAEIGNLHLRLAGLDMICKWEAKPITLQDLLAVAQAMKAQLENIATEIRMGFTTGEDAAIAMTGSGLADEAQHKRWLASQGVGAGDASGDDPPPDEEDDPDELDDEEEDDKP